MLNSYQKPGWMETADYYAADCLPLAMAYVPFQSWGDTKSAEDALECGTLFSDLVYPFKGGGNR